MGENKENGEDEAVGCGCAIVIVIVIVIVILLIAVYFGYNYITSEKDEKPNDRDQLISEIRSCISANKKGLLKIGSEQYCPSVSMTFSKLLYELDEDERNLLNACDYPLGVASDYISENTGLAPKMAYWKSCTEYLDHGIIPPSDDSGHRTAKFDRIELCKKEFDTGKVETGPKNCWMLYHRDEELSDACFTATDLSGDYLYLDSPKPSEEIWSKCLKFIEENRSMK